MFFDVAATRGSHHTRPGIEKRVVCGLLLVFAGLVGSLLVSGPLRRLPRSHWVRASRIRQHRLTTAINPTQKAVAKRSTALVPVATFRRACNRS